MGIAMLDFQGTIDQFRANIASQEVSLARCTIRTIAFRLFGLYSVRCKARLVGDDAAYAQASEQIAGYEMAIADFLEAIK